MHARTLRNVALMALAMSACAGGKSSDPIAEDWEALSFGGDAFPWTQSGGEYQYGERWLIIDSDLDGRMFDHEEYVRETSEGCEQGYDALNEEQVYASPVAADSGSEAGYILDFEGRGLVMTCVVEGDLLNCDGDDGIYKASFQSSNYSASADDLHGLDPCE